MSLLVPASTKSVLSQIETDRQPALDYEIGGKLSGLHQAEGLTEAERKGAWAEASAFNFTPLSESPWGTYYGPVFTAKKPDGSPYYAPDIAEIDDEIVGHWERRSEEAQHPVLRARYADVVWDLKRAASQKPADVKFARLAIDGYLDAAAAKLLKDPRSHTEQALERALQLAISISDQERTQRCKKAMLDLFDEAMQPGNNGVWTRIFDALIDNKKAVVTAEETTHLVEGVEKMLTQCRTHGQPGFDPWGAEAAARRLASYFERRNQKPDAQRVIRAYGTAFEAIAAEVKPMLAMPWLQPVHDEYKNRGMNEDAERVRKAIAEKGKNVVSDLKQIRIPVEFTEEQIQQLTKNLIQGSSRDALLRIARELVPQGGKIKELLQRLLTDAPLMARIGVIRIVGDHIGARAGSIEEDPEGRLIMQLAQQIQVYNLFLTRTLDELRRVSEITADSVLAVLFESPVFAPERESLLREGIQAYLDGDDTKAIHVLVPQIEQALRQLIVLVGASDLKAGRNATMQRKNLNDLLRESAIREVLGEDVRLYLQALLVDERGQNVRNLVCHGLADPEHFNAPLSNQVFHALLVVSLVRATVKLFQYGSNCDEERLNGPQRLGGAATNPVLVETVDEYDLAFNVWSKTNNCAATDLVQALGSGKHAVGVMYTVPADRIRGPHFQGKKTMTEIEGPSYEERPIRVRTGDGKIHETITFLVKADARTAGLSTSGEYVGHIVKGLRARGAPDTYIERVLVNAIETNKRANPPREDYNQEIRKL